MKPRKDKYGTATIINRYSDTNANTKPVVCNGTLGAKATARFDSRVNIVCVSYRVKIADADGITAKYFIDSLRYAGILQDDSPEFVESVTYKQIKVGSYEEEKTVIEIEVCE